jgi:hypothetical protein
LVKRVFKLPPFKTKIFHTLDYRLTDKASINLVAGNVFNRRTTTDRLGFLFGAIDGRVGRIERETQTWGRYWVVAIKGAF